MSISVHEFNRKLLDALGLTDDTLITRIVLTATPTAFPTIEITRMAIKDEALLEVVSQYTLTPKEEAT